MAIDPTIIRQPQMWQLVVETAPGSLRCMAFCPLEESSLMVDDIAIADGPDPVKALQDAVYDTPGLLLDYGRVTVLWRTGRYAVMPDFVTDDALAAELLVRECMAPQSEYRMERLSDMWPGMGVRLEYEVAAPVASFMRRTFNNPRQMHALTPGALWFAPRNSGRGFGKTLVNLSAGSLDIYVMGNDTPLLVNTYECPHVDDALYYILAAREALDIPADREILLAGDSARRVALSGRLRRFVRYVMPAIYPPEMFRAGKQVLAAPFEVAIAPVVGNRTENKPN